MLDENCGPLTSNHNLHPAGAETETGAWRGGLRTSGVDLSGLCATTDEVDNLDAVALFEDGLGPVHATDNLTVALDGQPLGPQFQQSDEGLQRCALRDFPLLVVDLDPQSFGLSFA
jgi:hypothetical protein